MERDRDIQRQTREIHGQIGIGERQRHWRERQRQGQTEARTEETVETEVVSERHGETV